MPDRRLLTLLLVLGLALPAAASAQGDGSDEAPADEAPADEAPADEAPADEAPAPDAPVDGSVEPAPEPAPAPESQPDPEPSPGLEEPPPPEWEADKPPLPSKPVVGYAGGFFIEDQSGDFQLKFNGVVQFRLLLASDLAAPGEIEPAFYVPLARLKVSAKLWGKVKVAFQIDFGKGNVAIKDAYIDVALHPWFHVKAGQFKKPFSRQSLTSAGKLQLLGGSVANDHFAGDSRDLGLMLHNGLGKAKGSEYALAIIDGSGSKGRLSGDVAVDPDTGEGSITSGRVSNVPATFHPTILGRIGWNDGGKVFDEVDPGGSGQFAFGFGVTALLDLDADDDDDGRTAASVDYILRAGDFSHLGAFYVGTKQDGAEWTEQAFDAFGLHLQAGYVIKDVVEPAVRWSRLFVPGDDNDEQEFTGGVNVYIFKHKLKWGTLASVVIEDDPTGAVYSLEVISQLQAAF
jgi:hypothetical protein